MWLLGCVLEAIAYGILMSLVFTCFIALRERKAGNPRVNRGLIVYTLLAGMLVTAAEISGLYKTFYALLDETCVGPYMHVSHPYSGGEDIISFFITLLTDGLLVWRCYTIATRMKGERWFALLWVIPLVFYIAVLGTSIGLITGIFEPFQKLGFLAVLFPIYLGTSAFLNVLITSIIVLLLFRHRRMMTQTFGSEQHLPLLNIMVILVESAALIVVVDIVVIVCITSLGTVGEMVSQPWNVVQPIASLLIIERVSRNSDYFSRAEGTIVSQFSVSSDPSSSNVLVSFPQK